MKQKLDAKFVSKAVVWFLATLVGGVWFSGLIAGCNL